MHGAKIKSGFKYARLYVYYIVEAQYYTRIYIILCELSITMQISHSPFGLTSY